MATPFTFSLSHTRTHRAIPLHHPFQYVHLSLPLSDAAWSLLLTLPFLVHIGLFLVESEISSLSIHDMGPIGTGSIVSPFPAPPPFPTSHPILIIVITYLVSIQYTRSDRWYFSFISHSSHPLINHTYPPFLFSNRQAKRSRTMLAYCPHFPLFLLIPPPFIPSPSFRFLSVHLSPKDSPSFPPPPSFSWLL